MFALKHFEIQIPRHVWALASLGIVLSSVERHRCLTVTVGIVCLVAPANIILINCSSVIIDQPWNGNLGDLNRTAGHLTCHQDLARHDLVAIYTNARFRRIFPQFSCNLHKHPGISTTLLVAISQTHHFVAKSSFYFNEHQRSPAQRMQAGLFYFVQKLCHPSPDSNEISKNINKLDYYNFQMDMVAPKSNWPA